MASPAKINSIDNNNTSTSRNNQSRQTRSIASRRVIDTGKATNIIHNKQTNDNDSATVVVDGTTHEHLVDANATLDASQQGTKETEEGTTTMQLDKTNNHDDHDDHEVTSYNHQCYICDKIFSANSNLNRHLRKIHKENVQSPYNNVKCALCDATCPSSSMYIIHLDDVHHVHIETDELTFPDAKSFDDWKYDVENATMSQFIKSRGEKRSRSVNKTYYSCNRSGYYISKARTQKALKKQGSRKINGRCPASINVTIAEDSTHHVRFIKTHVGHDFSLKHLDLSEKDRDLIINKLAAGLTKKDIIKQIRSASSDMHHHHQNSANISPASSVSGANSLSVTLNASVSSNNSCNNDPLLIAKRSSMQLITSSDQKGAITDATSEDTEQQRNSSTNSPYTTTTSTPLPSQLVGCNNLNDSGNINGTIPTTRIHLATTKDIHNILNSKHLDSKKIKHNYDLNQVEQWIDEMKGCEKDSSVLLYKDQGANDDRYPKLKADDFMLILMKPGQEKILRENGPRCIVLDSTHQIHCEYLHVAYLAVIDQDQRGFPVAFMFSSRTDSDIMEVFFTLLKERVGLISTRMLIADENHEFYQAWWRVMTMPLHNLLSPWTVFDKWNKKFHLIKNREKSRKLKRQLRNLLNEPDQDKFARSMANILELREDPDMVPFVEFFEENYCKNPEVWSGYFRRGFQVSNQRLTQLHGKFKQIYKEGKNSKRMCKFINGLLNLFEDSQLELIKWIEENDENVKRSLLNTRHKQSTETIALVYEVAVEPVYWLCPVDGASSDTYFEIRRKTNHHHHHSHKAATSKLDKSSPNRSDSNLSDKQVSTVSSRGSTKRESGRQKGANSSNAATSNDGCASTISGGSTTSPSNPSSAAAAALKRDPFESSSSLASSSGHQHAKTQVAAKRKKCCGLVCPRCDSCRHEYECTCLDYLFNLNMCKHIHRVASMCKTPTAVAAAAVLTVSGAAGVAPSLAAPVKAAATTATAKASIDV